MLIKLILNTVKLLMKKKSYILIGIIMPAFIVVFFSFEFGTEYKYKVGIVDKDKSYASNEIIKSKRKRLRYSLDNAANRSSSNNR